MSGRPTFEVQTKGGWSIIRNGPAGVAIGNARTGWEVVARSRDTYGYIVGYVRGTKDYAGCAWLSRANLERVGPDRPSRCEWLRFSRRFASRMNCPNCGSGSKVHLIKEAVQYANYSKRFGLRDELRRVPAGRCVEWRWVSANGGAVMVKDRRFRNSEGSWVFVSRKSLPEDLPKGRNGSCQHGYHRTIPNSFPDRKAPG